MFTMVEMGNTELRNELIQKGDLKLVCEIAKAFKRVKEENDTNKGWANVKIKINKYLQMTTVKWVEWPGQDSAGWETACTPKGR